MTAAAAFEAAFPGRELAAQHPETRNLWAAGYAAATQGLAALEIDGRSASLVVLEHALSFAQGVISTHARQDQTRGAGLHTPTAFYAARSARRSKCLEALALLRREIASMAAENAAES